MNPNQKLLVEIQYIFDTLTDDTLVSLTDGEYTGKLSGISLGTSKNGNPYVRLTLKVEGYFEISKFIMLADWNKSAVNIFKEKLYEICRNIGKPTNVLEDAVKFVSEYIRTNDIMTQIYLSDSENEYPTIKLKFI